MMKLRVMDGTSREKGVLVNVKDAQRSTWARTLTPCSLSRSSESDSSLGESSISGDDETLKVRAGGLKEASPKKRAGGSDGVPELDNSSSLDSDSGLLNDSSDSDTVHLSLPGR